MFAVSVLSIFVMMKVLPVWKILGDKSMAFGVGFCQSQKTFVQVSQKFRLVNQLCKSFCKFRVSAGEDGRIGKDHLCHALCHIAFHIA